MVSKTATVTLLPPTGGWLRYDEVEVTHYDKNCVMFSKREENGDQVTVTDHTSTLPYLITETMTGPKSLL